MPVEPEDLDLVVLTSLAGTTVDGFLLRRLRTSGHPLVRRSHGYVIQLLVEGEPTVGEIATALRVSQQAASKSVAEIERLGYAERQPDARDSRARRVRLTDRGAALVELSRQLRRDLVDGLTEQVGAADAEATRRTLLALIDACGGREAVMTRRVRPPAD